MTDREKVIKGLECCMLSYKDGCDDCPYTDKGMCQELLGENAIALLKAQEPVNVVYDGDLNMTLCGNCGATLDKNYGNCPECGQAVKWE